MEVDLAGVSRDLFILSMILVLITLSFFSMSVLKAFQLKKRAAILYLLAGIATAVIYTVLIMLRHT